MRAQIEGRWAGAVGRRSRPWHQLPPPGASPAHRPNLPCLQPPRPWATSQCAGTLKQAPRRGAHLHHVEHSLAVCILVHDAGRPLTLQAAGRKPQASTHADPALLFRPHPSLPASHITRHPCTHNPAPR